MLRRQLAKGLMELTHSQAVNITTLHDWSVLFSLLEFAATCRPPNTSGPVGTAPPHLQVTEVGVATECDIESALVSILYNYQGLLSLHVHVLYMSHCQVEEQLGPPADAVGHRPTLNQFDLLVEDSLPPHDPEAFFITCESLCYLVRDEGCVTVTNFTAIVRTVRLLTEVASSKAALEHDRGKKKEGEQTYTSAALKLLDLLDTLYSRTQAVFSDEAALTQLSEGGRGGEGGGGDARPGLLWHMCWCPLLEVRCIECVLEVV